MSQPTKIELTYPLDIKGTQVSVLTMRRPKARDLEIMERTAGGSIAKTITLIANLAEITPHQVRELDGADFERVSDLVSDFLSPPLSED